MTFKEKNPGYWRSWYAKNKVKIKAQRWKRVYGLTPEDYKRLFETQKGLCAVCKDSEATHIDHCHKTGRVRGLLCHQCNAGIGLLRDSVNTLQAAIDYISK